MVKKHNTTTLYSEPIVSPLPVILARVQIQLVMDVVEKFHEFIYEIKDSEKSIILNKCQLDIDTNRLNIEGCIYEKIEYATATTIRKKSISGNIRKSEYRIPFKGSKKVFFTTEPKTCIDDAILEIESFNNESFNMDKIFYNVDGVEIFDIERKEKIKSIEKIGLDVYTFERLRKKIIVTLDISLLERQRACVDNDFNSSIE